MSWLLDCLVVILIALLFGFLVRYAVMLPALLFGFLARYAVILTALLFGFLARYAVILTALLFSFLVRYAVILTALLFGFLARYAVILTALFGFLARYADCLSNTTCLWMPLPSFASILTSSRTVSAFLNWHLNTALGCPDSKCVFYFWAEQGVCVGGGGGCVCVCSYACLCVVCVCVCVCVCAFMVLSACICFMFGYHVHGFTVVRWSVSPGFSCLETCLMRPSSWDWQPSRLNTQASITSRQPTMPSSANSSAMASVWWVLHADY